MEKVRLLATQAAKHPRDVPAYLLAEAAHHLRLPLATVRAWALGRPYPVRTRMASSPPLIKLADPAGKLLSFQNLVELHVLSSIRRTYKVELKSVRRAIKYLENRFDSKHPLLEEEMLTDGKNLFVEKYGQLVNISQHGQTEMKLILALYLKRIERDESGIPIWLFPFTRPCPEDSPRFIVIDPRIQFGKPCIAKAGVPTAIIAERHQAGESVVQVADDYGRTTEEIEEAIRYESRMAS